MPVAVPAYIRPASFFFWTMALVHLAPIWCAPWYVSLDGPCHLYNARLLHDLLQGDPYTTTFFVLNPFPEPYWSGQLLMALGFSVLPGWLVEKLVFTTIILGTAFAFRKLTRTLAPDRPWTALLAMPFLLHYGLPMGFINFGLSLPLLLLTVHWTLTALRGPVHPLKALVLFTLLYFTHPSTFVVTLGISVMLTLAAWRSAAPTQARRCLRAVVIGAAAGCALLLAYILHHPTARGATARIPVPDLLTWIGEGRAFNALGVDGELLTSSICAIVLLVLMTASGVLLFRRSAGTRVWALLTLCGLAAYLLVPDVMAGGSSTSPRVLLFLFLLMALWIVATPLPRWTYAGLAILVLSDAAHTVIQTRSAMDLSRSVEDLLSVSAQLERNSVLLPLNYSDNWMHSNISNYLGVQEQRVVVLDNFVATAPFAPVRWREEMLPYAAIGSFSESNRPCIRIAGYAEHTGQRVDQVLLWMRPQEGDSCMADALHQLDKDFPRSFRTSTGNTELRLRDPS
ncbi:MAG TPA: hypothetical protein VGE21_07190 [Flavobacteriales bacterium]